MGQIRITENKTENLPNSALKTKSYWIWSRIASGNRKVKTSWFSIEYLAVLREAEGKY